MPWQPLTRGASFLGTSSPSNILLVGGHAVVADFGIAQAMSAAGECRLTGTGLALGTPHYMSPEQATGGVLDGRADLYSLGCMVYEMLTGTPPFTGASVQAVLARHSVDVVPRVRAVRPAVPEAVDRVLLHALAKAPADRYATMADFAAALSRAASGTETVPAVARRRGRPAVVLAGAVLAVAAAGSWGIARFDTRAPGLGTAAGGPPPQRLAVLSFANLSPDSTDAYLARPERGDLRPPR